MSTATVRDGVEQLHYNEHMRPNTSPHAISALLLLGLSTSRIPVTRSPSAPNDFRVVADTVLGVVFDSLLNRPISGASVLADPGGETATTDDLGQFKIQSSGRVRRLTVFHGLLDHSGIGSLTSILDTAARRRSPITIATPSLATVWERLCPGQVPEHGRQGIVFGAARAANGTTRVSGAHVRATWESDAISQAGRGARVVDVRTDSIGTFYVCGVPALTDVFVMGYSVELSSGSIGLPADSLPLRRQDLILAAPGQTGTIHGVVQNSRRGPVVGATIDVEGLGASMTTDGTGHFAGTRVPAGTRSMLVRAVGFSPVLLAVEVLDRDGEDIRVELERNVFLPGVKVTERTRVPLLRQQFEDRRRLGVGQFVDTAEIKSLYNVRSIFQGRPGMTLQGIPPEFTLWMNATAGFCQPAVFLDGFRSDMQVLSAMGKDLIAGVEIYLRPVEIPAHYALVQRSCGAVLVWTKDSFSR